MMQAGFKKLKFKNKKNLLTNEIQIDNMINVIRKKKIQHVMQ